jgi:hypothetical protein
MNNTSSFPVIWGTLALINAGLAHAMDRSRITWFLLSLLLGPIATFILVAFVGKAEPAAVDSGAGEDASD